MTMTYGCPYARSCDECPMALAGVMRCDKAPCERCRYWVARECTLPPAYPCEWRDKKWKA